MPQEPPVYLDFNATTPVAAEVLEAMAPYWRERFHNPSAPYPEAEAARTAVETARAELADLIAAPPPAVVFTSGGTESDNWALWGAWRSRPGRRRIVISAIEHPAVAETAHALAAMGAELTVVPVDANGMVRPEAVGNVLDQRVAVVSIMLANNEIGTLQPVAEIARLAHAVGALVHTDAAQAVGKTAVDVQALDVDLLTVAGHKLYAPKGIGALYIRPGLNWPPLVYGGGQENGQRSGTENVPLAVGLGAAARLARTWLAGDGPRLQQARRDRLEATLQAAFGSRLKIFGQEAPRLPNTSAIALAGWVGASVLAACPDLRAGLGSACHHPGDAGSPTARAMGVAPEWARGLVRISLGRETDDQAVARAAAALSRLAVQAPPRPV